MWAVTKLSVVLCLRFAINATVGTGVAVGKLKDMLKLLLGRRDASGVLALNDVNYLLRKLGVILFNKLLVLDNVDRHLGVDVTENSKVDIKLFGIYLYYILASHTAAGGVSDKRNSAVNLVKSQESVNLHSLFGLDMVKA